MNQVIYTDISKYTVHREDYYVKMRFHHLDTGGKRKGPARRSVEGIKIQEPRGPGCSANPRYYTDIVLIETQ